MPLGHETSEARIPLAHFSSSDLRRNLPWPHPLLTSLYPLSESRVKGQKKAFFHWTGLKWPFSTFFGITLPLTTYRSASYPATLVSVGLNLRRKLYWLCRPECPETQEAVLGTSAPWTVSAQNGVCQHGICLDLDLLKDQGAILSSFGPWVPGVLLVVFSSLLSTRCKMDL